MDEHRRWAGGITVLLGVACVGLFATGPFSGPNASSGLAISVLLVLWGLFVYWNPDIGTLTSDGTGSTDCSGSSSVSPLLR